MRAGLIDLDGKIPNLALMKLSAHLKKEGHEVLFPWAGQQVDELYTSLIWTKNRHMLKGLPARAKVGGTGFDYKVSLPPEAEKCQPDYDLYGIDYGMGFLYRGCPRRCKWCVVWRKEPEFKRMAQIGELLNPKSNHLVLLDNNILAARDILDILGELADRRLTVNFTQGLDIRLVNPRVAEALAKVRFCNFRNTRHQLHIAWDSKEVEKSVLRGIETMNQAGIKGWQIAVYMLVGFDTTFEYDMYRYETLRALNCDPYVMTFEDVDGKATAQDLRLKHFERWVNSKISKVVKWEDYEPAKAAIAQAEIKQIALF